MADLSIDDFPEFENLKGMDDAEAIIFLMKLAKRYTTVAELAKKHALKLSESFSSPVISSLDGTTKVKVVTKAITKADTSTIKECYPEIYKEICDKGDVTISSKYLREYDLEGASTTTYSKYLELCH